MPCSWNRVFNILKSSSVSQIIFRSCTHLVKTQKVFCELYKLFLNFIWKSKGPRIAKRLLKIINKVCVCGGGGGKWPFTLSRFIIDLHNLDRVLWYEDKQENVKRMEINIYSYIQQKWQWRSVRKG